MNTYFDLGWGYGNVVMQYVAKIQFTSEDRYAWGAQGSPWNSFYSSMRDVSNILEVTEEAGQENYRGVALVMKAWMYSVMTDAYGDLPFAEATKGAADKNFSPAYDEQQKIYEGIIADLKEANAILATTAEPVNGDILFDGDLEKWKKFANSLRLRIYMRLSDRTDPSAAMQEILNNPEQFPVFEGIQDQASLQYLPAAPNQQPLYTTRSGSFDEYRLSETMENRLKGLSDPRLQVYAQPTTDSRVRAAAANDAGLLEYEGTPNSLADEAALDYSPSGDPAKRGSNYISRVGLMFACLACNEDASPTAAQSVLMSYSELQFILAEAAERGFISTGNAAEYYRNGIEASFTYYGERLVQPSESWYEITLSPDEDYLTQDGVAYSGTPEEKLKKIALQKWIALYFNGLEAWFDWRRTGSPEVIPGPDNVNGDRVPVRFRYPGEEQALNKENYSSAVQRQGADDINTRVWWDVD